MFPQVVRDIRRFVHPAYASIRALDAQAGHLALATTDDELLASARFKINIAQFQFKTQGTGGLQHAGAETAPLGMVESVPGG